MMDFSVTFLIGLLIVEVILRFCLFKGCPLRIRISYAFFCLSGVRVEEERALQQRIVRGGFLNEKELFHHYAKISKRSLEEIQEIFGRPKGWKGVLGAKYVSGGHTVMEQFQKMHVGLVPKPNQKLNAIEINVNGYRVTGFDPKKGEKGKVCLVIGGSATFGVGATADLATIPSRIGYYLNKCQENVKIFTINAGALGFNSLQELVSLLQLEIKPDYVVAFSGWNEVDQALCSQTKVSAIAQSCDYRANQSLGKKLVRDLFSEFIVIRVISRFIKAFIAYDCLFEERRDDGNLNIYTLF